MAEKSSSLNHRSPIINIEQIEKPITTNNTISRFFMIEFKANTRPVKKITGGKQMRNNEVMYG